MNRPALPTPRTSLVPSCWPWSMSSSPIRSSRRALAVAKIPSSRRRLPSQLICLTPTAPTVLPTAAVWMSSPRHSGSGALSSCRIHHHCSDAKRAPCAWARRIASPRLRARPTRTSSAPSGTRSAGKGVTWRPATSMMVNECGTTDCFSMARKTDWVSGTSPLVTRIAPTERCVGLNRPYGASAASRARTCRPRYQSARR